MSLSSRILALLCSAMLASPALAQTHPQSGGKLKVDGYELAYHCAGQGSPSIFLEPPSGISAAEAFQYVFDDIAKANRVCRFERLGMGDSDPVPDGLNQTVDDYARELGAVIDDVAPDDDIVIVGYSFGGLVARYYAAHHPERVRGLLLIDAAHEDWLREMKRQMSPADWGKMQEILDWFLENRGHNYWDSQFEMDEAPKLQRSLPVGIVSRGRDFQRIRLAEISEQGFRIYNDLHDTYQAAQEQLTAETTRVIAADSEHYIPKSQPELVLQELRHLLARIDDTPQ